MFVRKLAFHLKPNMLTQFITTVEKEIIPLLRKQPGFKDEIAFATPGSSDVHVISLWDTQQNAETYASNNYSDVLKMLAGTIEGTPKLETAEVVHSTFSDVRVSKPIAA
jgi:heme-degrading monooxygenase HmoA